MGPYSALDIVHLWEAGLLQHPLDRALTMLVLACPEMERSTLATLTLGQRDRLLFDLREQTFGTKLDTIAECPQCRACLEFSLPLADIRDKSSNLTSIPVRDFELAEEGIKLTFRLPDSKDLAVAAGSSQAETARAILVQLCVITAKQNGTSLPAHGLTDNVISRLSEKMAECDPFADILLNLDCPSCHVEWQQSFDIVSFFWAEITTHAKRLLHEVHTLARAYGWGEAEILLMSAARRNCYLEILGG
jgi:hypothetical protein